MWFVRYGLTEYPLVEDLGPYDSDIDPAEGIEHAKSIAKRIAAGIHNHQTTNENENENETSIPTVVYSSPFLRTAHTGYIIANELQQRRHADADAVELRLEEGLWEWLIPSLLVTKCDGIKTNPRPVDALSEKLVELERSSTTYDNGDSNSAKIAVDYQSVNPYDDSGDEGVVCVPDRANVGNGDDCSGVGKRPRWIESEADLLERCDTTLKGLLKDNHDGGTSSICVVSHAPCDQAMAFSLETAATTPDESRLEPWPLGGITVFSRPVRYDGDDDDGCPTGYGAWTMELYGNTEHMPGDYQAGLKEWSLPCFSK